MPRIGPIEEIKHIATGLSDEERLNFVRPKKNLYKKTAKKKRHKKTKRSNIKYFLTISLLTETTQKCTNFVYFAHISDFGSPSLNCRNLKDELNRSFRFRQFSEWTTEIRNMSKIYEICTLLSSFGQ